MLIKVKELSDKEAKLLMEVYKESNKENIFSFFQKYKMLNRAWGWLKKHIFNGYIMSFFKGKCVLLCFGRRGGMDKCSPYSYTTQEYVDNAVAFSYKYINNTQKL